MHSHSLRWHDTGLGFDFDWGGLITSVVTAGASYAVAKKQTDAKTAELKTQLAAQDALNKQLLLASQAGITGTIAVPPQVQQTLAPSRVQITPQGVQVVSAPASSVPEWLVPVGIAAGGAILLLALFARRPAAPTAA